MKKIPTIFERDWEGDRSRVLNKPNPACAWVFAGEGKATRKLDGTSCLIRGGKLYKRREVRNGQKMPPDFEMVEHDEQTDKIVGWVPVGAGPEDVHHRSAFANGEFTDGTHELIGPKVQGNPEHAKNHVLIPHSDCTVHEVTPDFDKIRDFLSAQDMEGLVWHHPDGRMAKIKLRDFGLRRPAAVAA
jgi:hypothetical protein